MDFERRYRDALKGVRSVPAEGLEGTAEAFAGCRGGKRRRALQLLLPIGAGGIALAVGCVVLIARPAPAVSLDDMGRAVQSSGGYHMVARDPSGNVYLEVWSKGETSLHKIGDGFLSCRSATTQWNVRRWSKTAAIGRPDGRIVSQTFDDLQAVIKRLRFGMAEGVTQTTVAKRDGTQLTTIEGKPKWGYGLRYRYLVAAELKTKLPMRIDTYTLAKGAKTWKYLGRSDITYGMPINEAMFEFNPPKDYVVFDHLSAFRQIQDGVEGSGPSKTVDGITIRLLGAFHEQGGWVRVLWCGGATPNADAEGGVLDEKGVGYKVENEFEDDDRRRPRNKGVQTPANKKPKMQRVGIDRPYQIRPLFYVGGTPIYAMRTMVEYEWPLRPRKLHVIIPVCKTVAPRDVKPAGYAFTFRSDGLQVGKAEFDVTTQPVEFLGIIVRQLDPQMMSQWSCAPLKGVAVDEERSRKIWAVNERKFMEQQQRDIDRIRARSKSPSKAKKPKG